MKGQGKGWKGESRRHSMARKGISTAQGKQKSGVKSNTSEQKQWVMYHGTGSEEAKSIDQKGLRQRGWMPISLTPFYDIALNYAIQGARFGNSESLNRTPVVYKFVITEKDFEDMTKELITDREDIVDVEEVENVVNVRIQSLDEVYHGDKRYGFEYEWYFDIPPERLERVE